MNISKETISRLLNQEKNEAINLVCKAMDSATDFHTFKQSHDVRIIHALTCSELFNDLNPSDMGRIEFLKLCGVSDSFAFDL